MHCIGRLEVDRLPDEITDIQFLRLAVETMNPGIVRFPYMQNHMITLVSD